ncbi:MAG: hypothetical protein H0U83_04795 [Sphingomonas sp.]|nr:hypothetical protein [Sphingomonas sp.]
MHDRRQSQFVDHLGLVNLYAIYVRLRLRGARKRIKALTTAAEAVQQAPLPSPATPAPEIEQLKQRVQVLERIATDGNPMLDREMEELRRHG